MKHWSGRRRKCEVETRGLRNGRRRQRQRVKQRAEGVMEELKS